MKKYILSAILSLTLLTGFVNAQSVVGNLSGRVTNPSGLALRLVQVKAQCTSGGTSYLATTSSFGYYNMQVPYDCELVVTASNKRYRFTPRILAPGEAGNGPVNFVGLD